MSEYEIKRNTRDEVLWDMYDSNYVNLAELLASVPKEYRKDVVLFFSEDDGWYGGSIVQCRVYYTRPETDEEMAERAKFLR